MNNQQKKKALTLIAQYNNYKAARRDLTTAVDRYDESTTSQRELLVMKFMAKRQAGRKVLLKKVAAADKKCKDTVAKIGKIDQKIGFSIAAGREVTIELDPEPPPQLPQPEQNNTPEQGEFPI